MVSGNFELQINWDDDLFADAQDFIVRTLFGGEHSDILRWAKFCLIRHVHDLLFFKLTNHSCVMRSLILVMICSFRTLTYSEHTT